MKDQEFSAADDAGAREQELYGALAVHYDKGRDEIVFKLARGLIVQVERKLLQGLQDASTLDLQSIELSPAGVGLHIESLDWDMSIEGIMNGRYGSPRWMMTHGQDVDGVVRSGPSRH